MTQEEKAQAYDEALNKAKIEIDTKGIGETVNLCYQLFPQLTENDDERIRKSLIKFLTDIKEISESGRSTWAVRKEDAEMCKLFIAWLEKQKESLRDFIENFPYSAKQKEQKTTNELEDAFKYYTDRGITISCGDFKVEPKKEQNGEDEETDFTIYHPLKNGKGEYECIPYSFYGSLTSFSEDKDLIDFLRTCFYTEEECNEWIKQQNEQKPDEWNKREKLFTKALQTANVQIGQLFEENKKLKEQKSEWSEEDEGELQNAIDALEFLGKKGVYKSESGYDAALQAAFWLKNLPERFNLQPKQEWSEEDELTIADLINYFEGDSLECSAEEMVQRIKSLRPSWKPNEEQINTLYDILHPADTVNRFALESLYNDLKKLM